MTKWSTYGYCIVRTGGAPEDQKRNTVEEVTCAEWSELLDKDSREVVKVNLGTDEILKRYSAIEAEGIVSAYRNFKVR